jgi:hypothetical protein
MTDDRNQIVNSELGKKLMNTQHRTSNNVSYLIYKRISKTSPPAFKPMKPTGWKRARRGCSAYASESDPISRKSPFPKVLTS